MALCWHSGERPFLALASGLSRVANAVYCDESCAHAHDGHGCKHEGHACGCRHSEFYDYDWAPSGEVAERWSESALANLLQFISRLYCRALSAEEIESRLEWWWRGEDRTLRRAMEGNHARVCERGRGVLVNRVTGEVIRARCKSWRECGYCVWVYGRGARVEQRGAGHPATAERARSAGGGGRESNPPATAIAARPVLKTGGATGPLPPPDLIPSAC